MNPKNDFAAQNPGPVKTTTPLGENTWVHRSRGKRGGSGARERRAMRRAANRVETEQVLSSVTGRVMGPFESALNVWAASRPKSWAELAREWAGGTKPEKRIIPFGEHKGRLVADLDDADLLRLLSVAKGRLAGWVADEVFRRRWLPLPPHGVR